MEPVSIHHTIATLRMRAQVAKDDLKIAKARAEQGGRHAKALADLATAADKLKLKPEQVAYLAEQMGISMTRPPEEDPRVRRVDGRGASRVTRQYAGDVNAYRSLSPRSLSWEEIRRLYVETSAEESTLALR